MCKQKDVLCAIVCSLAQLQPNTMARWGHNLFLCKSTLVETSPVLNLSLFVSFRQTSFAHFHLFCSQLKWIDKQMRDLKAMFSFMKHKLSCDLHIQPHCWDGCLPSWLALTLFNKSVKTEQTIRSKGHQNEIFHHNVRLCFLFLPKAYVLCAGSLTLWFNTYASVLV